MNFDKLGAKAKRSVKKVKGYVSKSWRKSDMKTEFNMPKHYKRRTYNGSEV